MDCCRAVKVVCDASLERLGAEKKTRVGPFARFYRKVQPLPCENRLREIGGRPNRKVIK